MEGRRWSSRLWWSRRGVRRGYGGTNLGDGCSHDILPDLLISSHLDIEHNLTTQEVDYFSQRQRGVFLFVTYREFATCFLDLWNNCNTLSQK